MGIGEQAQRENCYCLWGDGLRGQKGGNPQQGVPVEEDRTAMEAGHSAESHAAGGATIVTSLSPHIGACR